MPQEGLSMRKVKDVLRLRFELGLRQDQIARSCSIGQATVHQYLERATAAGLSWPLRKTAMTGGSMSCYFRRIPFAQLSNSGPASISPKSIANSKVTSM